MEIIIILALILLNGVFAMSEIAVVSARKSNLSTEAKRGGKSAKTALDLANQPDRFLSTVQVGITLIGILTGMYSGDVLNEDFTPVLLGWGVSPAYAPLLSRILIVLTVTYISIVFGELVPKRIGLSAAEKIAKAMALPMKALSYLASPFVWALSKSTALIIKALNIKNSNTIVTEEEIKSLIQESTEDGEVQAVEQDIVERVFMLGDRDMASIMTHRNDLIWMDRDMSKDEVRKVIIETPFNRYPVGSKNLEQIDGIVSLKDIFTQIDQPDFSLKAITRPAPYYYEGTEVYSALEQMKTSRVHHALITDEFGSILGMVTLKDIMEAIVGEIPEGNEEPDIVDRKDGSYLVDGQCSFHDFLMHVKRTELYKEYDYNTLSGLVLEMLEHIPQVGERVEWEGFTFEIVDMDGARIDKLLVLRLAQEKDED
jgi:Hemolysins and related proteins containing CBS domains